MKIMQKLNVMNYSKYIRSVDLYAAKINFHQVNTSDIVDRFKGDVEEDQRDEMDDWNCYMNGFTCLFMCFMLVRTDSLVRV